MDAEAGLLLYYLEGQRRAVFNVLDGLSDGSLRRAVLPSGWTCLGMVRHLAIDDERYWFRRIAASEQVEISSGDEAWQVPATTTAAEVLDLYRDEIRRSNAIIEETAQHVGHLDIARELLDGRTGLSMT